MCVCVCVCVCVCECAGGLAYYFNIFKSKKIIENASSFIIFIFYRATSYFQVKFEVITKKKKRPGFIYFCI
jgi:hypothetical protein